MGAGPSSSFGYDAAGDTTSVTGPGSAQSLSWNDAGQLASDTVTGSGAGSTGYVYDASGNLVMQSDPGAVTLYLPDEQVVYNTATQAVTATRYYSINGQVIAARSGPSVSYLDSGQQGTATVSVDSQSLAPVYRYYDPYGSPVGAPPPGWPGTRGFVGGTADPATGLTNLGAREYDPATGSFISPDPLLVPGDPQDLNAYAYALDDPSSSSDPTGQLDTVLCDGGPCHPTPRAQAGPPPAASSPPPFTAHPGGSCGSMCGSLAEELGLLGPVTTPVRTRRVRQVSTGITGPLGPGCNGFLFKFGACPSERGAAGTTAQEVRASAIGAALIVGGAILDPLVDAALGAGVVAEDAGTAVGKEITTYYPPDRGFFDEPTSQVLDTGTRIDRYGGEGGTFVSPEGTPGPMRALPPGATTRPYHIYEVANPLEVRAGTVAPWFGQLGLGTQYELPDSVGNLIENGYLKLAEDGG
jgi:RHS repeat-associated protein